MHTEYEFIIKVYVNYYTVSQSYICTGLDWPVGLQELEAPSIFDNRHKKAARSSALRSGCLYFQEITVVLISESRINDTNGNRTRDFPAYSLVPQPAAPQRALTILSA